MMTSAHYRKSFMLGGSISEIALVIHNLNTALDRINAGENPQAIIEHEIMKWKERETSLCDRLDSLQGTYLTDLHKLWLKGN